MFQNEKLKTTEYLPITVCPDCVKDGFQIDPRVKIPAYPVIESTCYTHLIIQGKIHTHQSPLMPKHRITRHHTPYSSLGS